MEKYIGIISIVIFTVQSSFGQIAMSVDAAESQGISLNNLESSYADGVHSNPDSAVFADVQNEYIKAYYDMIQEINTYLNTNNFKWGGLIRCTNNIYFNEEGRVDYFIYEFEEGELQDERLEEFDQLLNEFIADYQFPMTKSQKFSQCSPVNFRDVL